MELIEWAEQYIKHRDIFKREIAEMKRSSKSFKRGDSAEFLMKNKDGSSWRCLIGQSLKESQLLSLASLEEDERVVLVALNSQSNITFLIEHWREFVKKRGLKLVFVNRSTNEKWVLIPSSHDMIADDESLAIGLQAMYEGVMSDDGKLQ